jgi:hypothetical protein
MALVENRRLLRDIQFLITLVSLHPGIVLFYLNSGNCCMNHFLQVCGFNINYKIVVSRSYHTKSTREIHVASCTLDSRTLH